MSREDLLLYLCAHIRHHTFDTPLTHVWDLAELVAWAGTDFDWDAFWQRAAAWASVLPKQCSWHSANSKLRSA